MEDTFYGFYQFLFVDQDFEQFIDKYLIGYKI